MGWESRMCLAPVKAVQDRGVLLKFPNAFVGLLSFPGHRRAAAQQEGFGAMMSFTVHGGKAAAEALCASLRLISHASSLGGVESLIERRAQYLTDASRGTPPNPLRFSVGFEYAEDIWTDLAQALEASQKHAAFKDLV